jgi:hypothetical protein
MPGLNLGFGGGVKFGGAGTTVATAPPASIGQVAYGGGQAATSGGGGVEHWHIAVVTGVAATAWLMFLRWSLPG